MGAGLKDQEVAQGQVLPTLDAQSAGFELRQAGAYTVTKPACADPLARLFLARHTRLSRIVTVQELLLPDEKNVAGIAEFVTLAREATRMRHPQLAEISEFLEPAPGHYCCVMEPLFGETLRARINRGGVTVPEALEILCQLTEGLSALHAAKRVHGCLTASRVFLADGERGAINVKLFDYGLGASQAVLLEPEQRAPEQKAGGPADALTDVYFLGSLVSEMISGSEAIPDGLQAVVAQARSEKPSHRYRNVGTLCAAVIEVLSSPNAIAQRQQPPPPRPRRLPVAALLVAVIGAAAYFNRPTPAPLAMEAPPAPKVVAAAAPPPVAPPVAEPETPSLMPSGNLALHGALKQAGARPVKAKKVRRR